MKKDDVKRSAYDPSKALKLDGEKVDPYYYEQPPLEFIEDLKAPYYRTRPENYNARAAAAGEATANGIFIDAGDFRGEDL